MFFYYYYYYFLIYIFNYRFNFYFYYKYKMVYIFDYTKNLNILLNFDIIYHILQIYKNILSNYFSYIIFKFKLICNLFIFSNIL